MIQFRVFLVILTAGLAGCSNSPRPVEASVPLVQQSAEPLGIAIPEIHMSDLENPKKTTLNHSRYKIAMGSFFTSSLGNDCRELIITQSNGKSTARVACAAKRVASHKARAWYLIQNIVQSSFMVKL